MTLTSSSTLQDALDQYADNLSWEGSPAKAVLALEAVRYILLNRAEATATNGRSANYASLEAEKARLESYVATSGGSVNRVTFTQMRAARV